MRDADDELTGVHEQVSAPAIDDRFLGEWVGFGLRQLETYLGRHARFEAWCERNERTEPQGA
jgi:hypothetical protein